MKTKEPIIRLQNVTKYFIDRGDSSNHLVLKDFTFDILPQEIFLMVGPSGAGKSTVLRIISGLEKNFTGKVFWGDDISKKDISFVFQEFALLPWLTVYDNVALGLRAQHMPEDKIKERVLKELAECRLEKFKYAFPRELSGGMKQRVGIARALATNPKIIFMDEPFSELDSFTAEELRQELLRIWNERKLTIVMVTHIVSEAVELADRIAVLTPRPATIEKIVTNKLPRPRKKRTKAFFGIEDTVTRLIKP